MTLNWPSNKTPALKTMVPYTWHLVVKLPSSKGILGVFPTDANLEQISMGNVKPVALIKEASDAFMFLDKPVRDINGGYGGLTMIRVMGVTKEFIGWMSCFERNVKFREVEDG